MKYKSIKEIVTTERWNNIVTVNLFYEERIKWIFIFVIRRVMPLEDVTVLQKFSFDLLLFVADG